MSNNIHPPAPTPSGADTINTDQIKKSSARTCSVISFYRNTYASLGATAFGLLAHLGAISESTSGETLLFVFILLVFVVFVGILGVVTMGYRIDKINRLTQSLVETIGRRTTTIGKSVQVEAVSVLSEVLADYKSIPCAAFWRNEPFVLQKIGFQKVSS